MQKIISYKATQTRHPKLKPEKSSKLDHSRAWLELNQLKKLLFLKHALRIRKIS